MYAYIDSKTVYFSYVFKQGGETLCEETVNLEEINFFQGILLQINSL